MAEEGTNVFQEAYSTVEAVDALVSTRIADAVGTASSLNSVALTTINALKSVDFGFNVAPPPSPPDSDIVIDVDLNLPRITPSSFGTINATVPSPPSYDGVPSVSPISVAPFQSMISGFNIPEPPAWTAPANPPERPTTGDVVIPTAPDFALPPAPTLDNIVVPNFSGMSLPTFTATAPEFTGSALPGILQWAEPTYYSEILDEVLEVIRRLWAGGSGIPEAVEQAMFERAMAREDMAADRELDAIDGDFSMRGFTMPTGMQAARVDQLRQDLAVKKLGLNRELTIKFAEVHIENIRFGVQQAIAAENVYVNLFLNAAQRMFEAARFQIESQINIYNAQVSLFNAKMNAYQVAAGVFDTLVRAELSKIEAYKAEVEAEVARGQVNEQRVRTYVAQVQAASTVIEVFKARMEGARVESDVIRNQIEAYRADVQAYGERIQADKTRFDAYESQVKGESAKAGIIDSEARAYAALVQGKAAIADVDVKRAELVIQKNRAKAEAFSAEAEAAKAKMVAQQATAQAAAQAYIADTQRYAAVAAAETGKAQVEVSAQEVQLRSNIALYQAEVQQYISNMEQMIRRTALIIEALKSAGQLSTTLAAGAMAGVHVGATLSGGGSVTASGQVGESFSTSNSTSTGTSTNYNYNYEGT